MTRRAIVRSLLGLACAAGMPLADARAQASARGLDRLEPATRAAVQRLADSVAAAGLPAEPLYAKAAEGVLKNADDARILAAIRTLVRELGDARGALGPSANESELVAAASALHAGVALGDIRKLRESRDRGAFGARAEASLATPLVVLGDLVSRRVPAALAVRSLDQLLARGAPDDELRTLRAGVERDILSGRAPDAATTARTRAVLDAMKR